MTNPSSHHEPSAEFRAQLKREIARAVRSDQLFGAPPAPARTRRIATAFGIAAGVLLTLLTGMVLGASASYASASEPDAPRPTFAMRPITNALTAIGCGVTKTEPQAPKTARVAPPAQTPPIAAVSADSTTGPQVRRGPDRTKITALATQYQPHVIRGDTTASYMVMVFDAADRYLWSTFGSGGLSVEIGGDARTAAERAAYMKEYRAQYEGDSRDSLDARVLDYQMYAGAYDKVYNFQIGKLRKFPDSSAYAYFDSARAYVTGAIRTRGGDSVARGGGARGGGGRGAISDSLMPLRYRMGTLRYDSLTVGYRFEAKDAGRGNFTPTGVSPVNALDGSYSIGWGGTRRAPSSNNATGLTASGNGQSGIEGIPSTWLSMGESYVFGPGELAPQMLRIMVVHLTPGTTWKGR